MSTYNYIRNSDCRENNLYIEEYYSSVDTKIKFNDALFTNINYIQFQIDENIKPIYGYNSATFDDVAIGNRIISGIFKVPVRNYETPSDVYFIPNTNIHFNDEEYKPGWARNVVNSQYKLTRNNSDLYKNLYYSNSSLTYDENVKLYQEKLLAKGYNVNINGYMDIKTRNALVKYQSINNLDLSGELDSQTKDNIDNTNSYNAKSLSATNVYIGPSNNYYSNLQIAKDDKFTVIDKYNGYYLVNVNGTKGYIEENKVSMLQ